MTRPVLLDLFCCAGGAGVGYRRAGFDVVGIDIAAQPNYPHLFARDDALAALRRLLDGEALTFTSKYGLRKRELTLEDIAAVHGSPPCQASSALTKGNRARGWLDDHVDLIPETRDLFERTGLPYVIENVQGSQLRRDLTLCGEMFGLGVIRHRYFELGGWTMPAPQHLPHRGRVAGWRHGVHHDGPYFAVYGNGGGKGTVAQWQEAMGMPWTDVRLELAEAIPPAYAEHIGRALIAHLATTEA